METHTNGKGRGEGLDLSAGVPIDTIEEGEVLLGHVGQEAVVLVRHDLEYFAVASTCSHYGGPLELGIVTGDEIHCPWHHSVFCLRTGTALKAPALNPISCWHTEVRDKKIFVTEKKSFTTTRRKGTEVQQFVIVGSGAAGISAAVTLRRQGFLGSVTIVTGDKSLPYDRPHLSKDYLAGTASEEWIPLWSKDFYLENRITFELNTMVTKVSADPHQLELSNGRSLHYDKCLLAMGGTPNRPPIPGIDRPNVHFLRSLQDCRQIIELTSWASRVVIIGAGFIGLEAAASLRQRNLDVKVVAPEKLPLLKTLGVHVGSFLKHLHESHGVTFHLEVGVKEIRERSVLLDSGVEIECDFIVVGTGIHPNVALAEAAGCHIDRGVLVNEYLETTVPDVYAAGDLARWPDPRTKRSIRVEHWEVAERQGQVAALNMMGDKIPFQDVPFFWTKHYDVSIGYVGHSDRFDRMDLMGNMERQDFAVAFYEDLEVAALLTVGRDRESLLVEEALAKFDQTEVHRLLSEYAGDSKA